MYSISSSYVCTIFRFTGCFFQAFSVGIPTSTPLETKTLQVFLAFRKFSVNSLTAVKHLHIFIAANLRMPSLSSQDLFSERYATLTSDFARIHDWAGYDPALGSFLSLSRPLPPSCVGPQTTASSLQLVK